MSAPSDNEFDETISPDHEANETARPASGITFTPEDSGELTLAEYTIGAELGRGGMGSVLGAEHGKLERKVAIKVMLGQTKTDDPARIRFEREARILARLEHPNIVPIHDAGVSADGRPYYTMKLVKGRTLQSILNGIRDDEEAMLEAYKLDDLLTIFRKVCDAIAFAHHSGIVHRDLKPDNVMVGEFGEVLVMDWGLAKILGEAEPGRSETASDSVPTLNPDASSMTLDGQILGSPQYMAPEQATGDVAKIEARTDVYALGGILQAILTLEAPVSGSSLQEMISRIETGKRNEVVAGKHEFAKHCPLNRIPPGLTAVVGHAMSVKMAERYASAEDLGKEVSDFQGGFNTAAEKASRFRRFAYFLDRHKWIVVTLLLGVTAAMYTYLFGLLHLRKEQRRMTDEIRQYRRGQQNFNSLRWITMRDLKRPRRAMEVGEDWRNLWTEFMAQTNNPSVKPWIMGNRCLGTPPGNPAVLTFPALTLTNGWTIRMRVRKIFSAGALCVLFPAGEGQHDTLNIDARRDPDRMSGLEPPEGEDALPAQFVKGPHIRPPGDLREIEVMKKPLADGKFQFTASIDEREIINWTGKSDDLSRNEFWKPEDKTRLHLACYGGNWIIEDLYFRPHDGF
ncbi:MAG: serine/threonine-protein kinase [Limisphaerales bacterium]